MIFGFNLYLYIQMIMVSILTRLDLMKGCPGHGNVHEISYGMRNGEIIAKIVVEEDL
jgi:hypothetical protein